MEQISALLDGELDRDEAARVVRGMKEQRELRDVWSTYHLIGDVLRGECCPEVEVLESVVARLAHEPTVLAPRRRIVESMRRFALPSIASAAAIATLAWIGLQGHHGLSGPDSSSPVTDITVPVAMMPQTSTPVDLIEPVYLPSPPSSIQFPSRNIDGYLQAHQEFSPNKTMQGLVSYVRTVSTSTNDWER